MNTKSKKISIILLAICLLLGSCKNKQDDKSDILGEINYQAEAVWIEPGSSEDMETLDYREILDEETFVLKSEKPVLLCIKKDKDPSINQVIPWMEDFAYKYKDTLNAVMVNDDPDNDFLYYFHYTVTPTIYLINEGELLAQAAWDEEDAKQALVKKMQELAA